MRFKETHGADDELISTPTSRLLAYTLRDFELKRTPQQSVLNVGWWWTSLCLTVGAIAAIWAILLGGVVALVYLLVGVAAGDVLRNVDLATRVLVFTLPFTVAVTGLFIHRWRTLRASVSVQQEEERLSSLVLYPVARACTEDVFVEGDEVASLGVLDSPKKHADPPLLFAWRVHCSGGGSVVFMEGEDTGSRVLYCLGFGQYKHMVPMSEDCPHLVWTRGVLEEETWDLVEGEADVLCVHMSSKDWDTLRETYRSDPDKAWDEILRWTSPVSTLLGTALARFREREGGSASSYFPGGLGGRTWEGEERACWEGGREETQNAKRIWQDARSKRSWVLTGYIILGIVPFLGLRLYHQMPSESEGEYALFILMLLLWTWSNIMVCVNEYTTSRPRGYAISHTPPPSAFVALEGTFLVVDQTRIDVRQPFAQSWARFEDEEGGLWLSVEVVQGIAGEQRRARICCSAERTAWWASLPVLERSGAFIPGEVMDAWVGPVLEFYGSLHTT